MSNDRMTRISDIVELLAKKRRGGELNAKEIDDFVLMSARKVIHDSQIGAMLMAMSIRGLSNQETTFLTRSMANSGHVFRWELHGSYDVCDKHSTGGVGDKISIPLAPALAALGVKVPMLSGRGLNLTGGTLDKLESIPGFRVNHSMQELSNYINNSGVFIASVTEHICIGDKALYPIRDVTATVDCDGLIIGSILSKKAAAGVKHMVLDVKVGEVSQHRTIEEASAFARKIKENAKLLGMNLVCVLTEMTNPIGQYIGNSLEIEESIMTLRGKGPTDVCELMEVLGGKLLSMCGKAKDDEDGRKMIQMVIENGTALNKFHEMIVQQGVEVLAADQLCYGDYRQILPVAAKASEIISTKTGFVTEVNAKALAKVVRDLGGGRRTPKDVLDLAIGMAVVVKRGDFVREGDPWLWIHHNTELTEQQVIDISKALSVSTAKPKIPTSRILLII